MEPSHDRCLVNVAIKFNIHLYILGRNLGHQFVKKGVSDTTLHLIETTQQWDQPQAMNLAIIFVE